MSPTPRHLEVFAVEDDAAQVCWAALGPGDHELRAGGAQVAVPADAAHRPGAVRLHPLPPATELALFLDGRQVDRFTTLAPPPGQALARVATISDLHLGERDFGHVPRIHDDGHGGGHALVCLRAAVAELAAWGPDVVVVKGDVAHDAKTAEYDAVAEVLAELTVPLLVVRGNHDGGNHHGDDPVAALGAHGIAVTTSVDALDLPGLRVVVADTLVPQQGWGQLDRLDEVAEQLHDAPLGALLALHHRPQRSLVPTHWPPGILGLEGVRVLRRLARAHPATLVTAGHSHRHRRHAAGPVVVTEVGSTKDFPGTWAGYVAHEGGIRQVVQRVAHPDAMAWTERTRAMGLGQWGRWAPGRLHDRSFRHVWPA